MKRTTIALLLGCAATPAANAPSGEKGSASVDASMTCTGAGGAQWSASFAKTSIDECVYHEKDAILDLRFGTLEQGVTVHLVDFNGTGQYTIAGAPGSKLTVVASGGSGESTSTNVDTTSDDPCKASCMVDVPEASVTKGEGTLSIEINCASLTRNAAGSCTKCAPKQKTLLRANAVPCLRR
jgi:hypothetical protein